MRYYVVSDVHGYFTYLKKSLVDAGFFEDNNPKKLVVCGDLFDRGTEAKEMQAFIIDLMHKDEVILIRGNHEDLFMDMIDKDNGIPFNIYLNNGTYGTALQLTDYDKMTAYRDKAEFVEKCKSTPYYKEIINSMRDYFETEHYIFVHGWIPMLGSTDDRYMPLEYIPDWRNATKKQWNNARWENGMEASLKVKEPNKTIVCGHWHCSYGHCNIEFSCTEEFGENADYTPYYGDGIIAIDACTPRSKMVNCIVIDD